MFYRLRYRAYYWLLSIFHDLVGHPSMLHDDRCRYCGFTKALCLVCWHHYTVER